MLERFVATNYSCFKTKLSYCVIRVGANYDRYRNRFTSIVIDYTWKCNRNQAV